jgi:dienelactone hydrolase
MPGREGDMSDIQSKSIEYDAGGKAMSGYLAWDAERAGVRPGVLVVHEWWGNNDYVQRRANLLADLGYVAMAVDMYGEGRTADNPDDAGALMNDLLSDLGTVRKRFDAALETLRAQDNVDAGRVAAIGYCMGGGIVLHMARYGRDLRAVASFHGALPLGVAPAGEGGEVTARIAVYHGEDDGFVAEEDIGAFKDEMRKTDADCLFVTLPGALHGFTNPQATVNGEKFGIPLRYSELADRSSWDHMQLVLQSAFA